MAMQVAIGAAIGFAVQLAFDALVIAGQTIAMTMGLGFATLVDPGRGATTPVLSQFFLILGLLLFLSVDGHIALIGVLVESFRWAPIGPQGLDLQGLLGLTLWGGRIFESGLTIALPAVIALLGMNIGMGIVSRAAPQLNLFAVGFPVAMLVGYVVMLLSLPALAGSFLDLLGDALQTAADVAGRP
jgi:flagellar biosynthetic protein FliR